MAHRLLGTRVLLTGGTSGIGLATARAIVERTGVVALGLVGRDDATLRDVASSAWAAGKISTQVLDLNNINEIKPAVDRMASKLGGIDVLISNAGMMTAGLNVTRCSIEAWQKEIAINLTAPFMLTQAAVPYLEQSRCAAIVHVSSICSTVAFENLLPYCAAKAGVDQLTRCSALELGPRGIRVNAVNPGIIDTPLNKRAFDTNEEYSDYLSKSSDLHPVGRCGAPDDVADLIVFLADTKISGFITGQMHKIDGGRTLPAPSLQFKSTQAELRDYEDRPVSLGDSNDHSGPSNGCAPQLDAASDNQGLAPIKLESIQVKLGSLDIKSPFGTSFSERSITGKVILVTGAARGIGATLAAQLSKRGAKVLLADCLQEQLECTAQTVSGAATFVYNQADIESIKAMFEAIATQFGYLDVLVANAGVMAGLGVDITDTDDKLESMNWRVNAEGCSQVVKYALPLLLSSHGESSFGRTVIFIGSSSARLSDPDPGYGALSYRGSRTAVNGMMVALHSLYCDDNETAKQLRKGRRLQRVVSGDPGYVASALGDDDPTTRGLTSMSAEDLMKFKRSDGAQTLEEGADTLVYLVCADHLPQNGKMYYQRKVVPW